MNYEEQILKLQLENARLKVFIKGIIRDLNHINNFADNVIKTSDYSKEQIEELLNEGDL